MENLYLRPAGSDDVKLFFDWVNEPKVRANSFNTAPISWEEHRAWFQRAITSQDICIYVLMKGQVPIGQVRLTAKDNTWNIDYSIDKEYRGQGYGKAIFELLEKELSEGTELMAEVKYTNKASQAVLEKMGYRLIENNGNACHEYRKRVR